MAERRKLTTAVKSIPNADPNAVLAFVTQERTPSRPVEVQPTAPTPVNKAFQPVGLIPITVRLSPEVAGALKRASLERQLAGADFFSQQEIVERALVQWMADNGHFTPQ